MRKPLLLSLLLSLLALLTGIPGRAAYPPGMDQHTLRFAGKERSYLVYLPPSYDGRNPLPLVLIFHGGFQNAEKTVGLTGFNALAEREGFIAVYPNGSGRRLLGARYTWNAGLCCGFAQKKNIDDVGFIKAMLERLKTEYRVDPKRVYATGISNGAMMVYRLACEMPDQLAAIAPVSGTLETGACAPGTGVAVMHIHGTADQNVPITGGKGSKSRAGVEFRPVYETLSIMRGLDGCEIEATPRTVSPGVQEFDYACRVKPVVFVKILGGGHTWPGSQHALDHGDPASQFQASRRIWEFFSANPGIDSVPNPGPPVE